MLKTTPKTVIITIILVPPYEISGIVIPFSGTKPTIAAILIIVCEAIQPVMPATKSRLAGFSIFEIITKS